MATPISATSTLITLAHGDGIGLQIITGGHESLNVNTREVLEP